MTEWEERARRVEAEHAAQAAGQAHEARSRDGEREREGPRVLARVLEAASWAVGRYKSAGIQPLPCTEKRTERQGLVARRTIEREVVARHVYPIVSNRPNDRDNGFTILASIDGGTLYILRGGCPATSASHRANRTCLAPLDASRKASGGIRHAAAVALWRCCLATLQGARSAAV